MDALTLILIIIGVALGVTTSIYVPFKITSKKAMLQGKVLVFDTDQIVKGVISFFLALAICVANIGLIVTAIGPVASPIAGFFAGFFYGLSADWIVDKIKDWYEVYKVQRIKKIEAGT